MNDLVNFYVSIPMLCLRRIHQDERCSFLCVRMCAAKVTPSCPVLTWLHCNCLLHWSLPPCGKGLLLHGHTHSCIRLIHFAQALHIALRPHDLSKPASHITIQGSCCTSPSQGPKFIIFCCLPSSPSLFSPVSLSSLCSLSLFLFRQWPENRLKTFFLVLLSRFVRAKLPLLSAGVIFLSDGRRDGPGALMGRFEGFVRRVRSMGTFMKEIINVCRLCSALPEVLFIYFVLLFKAETEIAHQKAQHFLLPQPFEEKHNALC